MIKSLTKPGAILERYFDVENRTEVSSEDTMFRGHSVVFNAWSVDVGGYVESISPEAWDSADVSRCLAVFNHKEELLLGTYAAGTLRMSKDEAGIMTEIDKSETSISRDCAIWVERNEITTQSFKFNIERDNGDEWVYDEANDVIRCVIKRIANVFDVSLVTRAAYQDTSVNMRARSEVTPEQFKEAFMLRNFSDKAITEAHGKYLREKILNRK
jgi:HK97 family phage prohead protease